MFDIVPVTSARPTDCGATCLKMLLSYYGINVDLQTLIAECNTGIAGCTAGDIKRVGKLHGIDVKVYGMKPYEVDDKTGEEDGVLLQDAPAIIWWMYGHWVVYGGIDEAGKVVIYNPDRGRYRVSQGTFKSFYTDVALFNGEPNAGDSSQVNTAIFGYPKKAAEG